MSTANSKEVRASNSHFVSPTHFIVEDFVDGLLIDWQQPSVDTDIGKQRSALVTRIESWSHFGLPRLLDEASSSLLDFKVVSSLEDLPRGLEVYTGKQALAEQFECLCRLFGVSSEFDVVKALLCAAHVTEEPEHFPCMLRCHDESVTSLEASATHFAYVYAGQGECIASGRSYPLYPGHYFSLPGSGIVRGASVEILSRFGYRGLFTLGGPIEDWGRLQYIDGCTDTLLIPPAKRGDACFNVLFFPPQTTQTQHTHPSLRCGMVVSGFGVCITPTAEYDLSPGKIFFLPPETWHSFHTASDSLTVVAFHPDSDFGPTDEDHPMLNRTFYRIEHLLRSLERRGCEL